MEIILFFIMIFLLTLWAYHRLVYNNSDYTEFVEYLRKETNKYIYDIVSLIEMILIIISAITVVVAIMYIFQLIAYEHTL